MSLQSIMQRLDEMIDYRYGHLIAQYDREPPVVWNKEYIRQYMRNYMQRYRKEKNILWKQAHATN